MAKLSYIAAAALALAIISRASAAQSASVSLTHTVTVTVPPRVRVQIAPTLNQQQSVSTSKALAVNVDATRGWVIVVTSKKNSTPTAGWSANGTGSSSMVLYRSQPSARTPEMGAASDSEPMMLTVVAP